MDSSNEPDRRTRYWLALIVVGAFVCASFMVLCGGVRGISEPLVAGLVGTVLGYLANECKQVISFYFGSSSGSDRKTELLAQSSPPSQ